MNPLHQQFVAEARELIQQAVDDFVAVERGGAAVPEGRDAVPHTNATAGAIERIFRAFHTLKGSAGVVGLPAMGLVLHAGEDVLAAVRAGRLPFTAAVVDESLACLDQVSGWVDHFEAAEALPGDADEIAPHMAASLRALLPTVAGSSGAASRDDGLDQRAPPPPSATALPPWLTDLVAADRELIVAALQRHSEGLTAISYEPRADCFFNGEDPIDFMRQLPEVVALRLDPRGEWPALDTIDPFACAIRLNAICAGDRAAIKSIFRFLSDQVRIFDLSPAVLGFQSPDATAADARSGLVDSILKAQQRFLSLDADAAEMPGRIGAAARVIANALRHDGSSDLAAEADVAGADAVARRDPAVLLAFLDRVRSAPASAAGVAAATEPPSITGGGPGGALRAGRVVRIAEQKIDALVNLAGELIVAKNGLAHLARQAEELAGAGPFANAVKREQALIERVASEMHTAVMGLRLVPIGQAFRRLPRFVRDMARQLGKDVQLRTRGEATEADKTIVDLVFEPLVHLVRNALDHGIEVPVERAAAGKPNPATLTIQAAREGDRFVLQVTDDGRGIDPAAVRRRAAEQNLATTDELAKLSDAEAIDLIFAAGFSTAAAISDVSGRGVGMDVVRNVAEQMGGRVSVTSKIAAGTTVRLALPLNISVSRVMIVEAGGQSFGIPMEAVARTVRVPARAVSRIKTNEGVVLHGRVVPICALSALMGLPARDHDRPSRLLIIIESGGRTAGIEIDAVRDRLDVVLKPMQGLLAGASGYAGTTLLGDGSVLLVLDPREILP